MRTTLNVPSLLLLILTTEGEGFYPPNKKALAISQGSCCKYFRNPRDFGNILAGSFSKTRNGHAIGVPSAFFGRNRCRSRPCRKPLWAHKQRRERAEHKRVGYSLG
jgi:hypothetical protein